MYTIYAVRHIQTAKIKFMKWNEIIVKLIQQRKFDTVKQQFLLYNNDTQLCYLCNFAHSKIN